MTSAYALWWTRQDRQGDIPCGEYPSEAEARAAQPAAEAVLLDQCADEEEKAAIRAGRWTVEPRALGCPSPGGRRGPPGPPFASYEKSHTD